MPAQSGSRAVCTRVAHAKCIATPEREPTPSAMVSEATRGCAAANREPALTQVREGLPRAPRELSAFALEDRIRAVSAKLPSGSR